MRGLMIPEERHRHDKAADAVRQGRPVAARHVRGGRRGSRVLGILLLSTAAVAVLLLALWAVTNGAFNRQNPTPAEQVADADAFESEGAPPASDAPTGPSGKAVSVPPGETPNVNAPTVPSN
jgi:cytoskeletal protein RodZ